METTRHFVATVFVVHDGATALHEHEKLDMWLPPGGHIDRDELPHEAALRELEEETGLDVDLISEAEGTESDTARPLPQPEQFKLEDIDRIDGEVAHQHIDFVYYARATDRSIDPAAGEAPPDAWQWFTKAELRNRRDELEADVVAAGIDAIETVEE
ncbi:NUDIX domain-containing protein [Natranaeroarchaeum sulfidigenes]|uniref:NUDIX family hydrolase n=1 Tax=Natranaeroarchaeum sulfidigenes TaxID=2784880 RepID=A0A897MV58_9EURY|nr:NUDIX domain-containing protein [Natranaeroarchaeum sulfidigenes]QSG02125.1 NUDIX family hydrolase [Natranaeroarchaeum sulfidigenes]